MSHLELGRLGLSVDVTPDGAHLETAAEAEALGFGTVWVAGGQLDRLDVLLDLLGATTAARVAPGIIPLGVYTAADVVDLYRRAEEIAPGRLVVGLGGPQGVPHPLARLGAFLDELDAAGVPARRRLLAALGPRKLELAARRAAGAVPLFVTPRYLADARERLGPDAVLAAAVQAYLGPDADAARDAARDVLSFLLGVRGYREHLRRQGFSDHNIDGRADRLVDATVPHGDAATIAAHVRALLAAGADHVVLSDLGGRTPELARAVAPLVPPVPH